MDIVVTNAGRAALINAPNTGTAAVTIAQVGYSSTAITPAPTMTVLPGEFKRLAGVPGEVVADDIIHVNAVDASNDAYELRSFALYLADGTLFALYGQPAPILEKTASSTSALSIDAVFADINAAQVTFGATNFTNPPATTERQGVVELATTAETQAGLDALRAISPAALKAALMTLLLGMDGSGSGLDADLLDGQHGTYYTNIPARLGYTPINRAGDAVTATINFRSTDSASIAARPDSLTALHVIGNGTGPAIMSFERPNVFAAYLGVDTDNRWKVGGWSMGAAAFDLWHSGNDGSGSGLDADLLDGLDSNYFVNIPARLGFTPANRAGDTFTGPIRRDAAYYFDFSDGSPLINFDANDFFLYDRVGDILQLYVGGQRRMRVRGTGDFDLTGTANLTYNGAVVWTAANDGAGSGLDAGLFAGQLPGYYTDIPGRLGFTPANRAGQTFSGDVAISHTGNSSFSVDSAGNVLGRLVAQADGNVCFYRNNGTGDAFVWGVSSQSGPFNIGMSLTRQGNKVWDSGNDGAGSGLDADLLDGLDSSYFVNIPARLGYTPVSKGGDLVVNVVSFVTSENESIAVRASGSTPLEVRGNGVGPALITLHRPQSHATFLGLDTDNRLKIGGWSAGSVANEIYHAGNDGSGSGLDADLLDGLQATDFLRQLAGSNAQNGYMRLSNGLMLVWGRWTSSAASGAAVSVSFPAAFSTEPYALMLLPVVTTSDTISVWSSNGITGSAFPGRCSQASIGCRFFAIGPA